MVCGTPRTLPGLTNSETPTCKSVELTLLSCVKRKKVEQQGFLIRIAARGTVFNGILCIHIHLGFGDDAVYHLNAGSARHHSQATEHAFLVRANTNVGTHLKLHVRLS